MSVNLERLPTRDEWHDWRHNTPQGQLFNEYLAFWINQLAMKMFDGTLIEGPQGDLKTFEEIAVCNIKEQTKAIIMKSILDLDYDSILIDLGLDEVRDEEVANIEDSE